MLAPGRGAINKYSLAVDTLIIYTGDLETAR